MTTDRNDDLPPTECKACRQPIIESVCYDRYSREDIYTAEGRAFYEGAAAERARIEQIINAYVAGRAAAEERWQSVESRQTERDRAQGAMDVRAIIREGEVQTCSRMTTGQRNSQSADE